MDENKKAKIMAITIGLVCFVFVICIFIQFKTVQKTDIAGIERMQETELQEALSEWKTKYNEANEELKKTKQKISEYTNTEQSNEKANLLLEEEVKNAQLLLGESDVEGEGVEITLADGVKETVDGIQAEVRVGAIDFIQMVNELKKAGAEAISINNERVVNMTDIVDIGNKYTLVNSQVISAPYIIKAIGNKSYLESALSIKNGYADQMKAAGKNINITSKKDIKIPGYQVKTDNDKMSLKYIKE